MSNVVDRLRQECADRRDRVAIVDGATRFTYGDLLDASARLATAFRRQGVRPYDRVALVCEDGIDYVALALGILEAGAVMVPIPANSSPLEFQDGVERMDVRWLVTQATISGLELERASTCEGAIGGHFQVFAREARDDLPAEYRACGPAFLRFSSGTTGTSKGVLISHQAIVERTDAADRMLRVTEDDNVMWLLSMSYHFVVSILLFLRRGACIVVCGRRFPADLEVVLRDGQATFMYASPVHYALMVDSPAFEREMLARMRMAVSTAMALPVPLARRFEEKFGLALSPAYGIIEVGLPCVALPGDLSPEGSVGHAGPDYELRISGVDRASGEILVRGRGMFSAYVSPWKSREEINPDGWFRTGDLGQLDADGFVYVDGRKEEMINFAGMKIFAGEVEAVLNQHPAITDSLVYGIPDPVYGEVPVARVVSRAGPLDVRDLRRFCYARLSSYKVPKRVEFVDGLERTRSGKLRRERA